MSKPKQHSQDHEEARTPLQAVVLADSFTQARRARRRRAVGCVRRAY
jgi:stress-induced morphogen